MEDAVRCAGVVVTGAEPGLHRQPGLGHLRLGLVALVPEPALVGSASVMHPTDGRLERPDPLPTLAQLDGFVADYEAVSGAPFSDHEHEVLADQSRGWPRTLRDFLDRSAPAAAPSPSAARNPGVWGQLQIG